MTKQKFVIGERYNINKKHHPISDLTVCLGYSLSFQFESVHSKASRLNYS